MHTIAPHAPPILDLIGRRWTISSPVQTVVFSSDSANFVVLGCDGKIWQGQTAEAESVMRRCHVAADTGRATISPRRKPIKPLSSSVLDDRVVCIAPLDGSFALGCASGRLLTIAAGGRLSSPFTFPSSVVAIASAKGALYVAGDGHVSHVTRSAAQVVGSYTGRFVALAVHAHHGTVAWSDERGIHILDRESGNALFSETPLEGAEAERHALAWSSSSRWLGVARGQKELVLLRLEDGHIAKTIRLPNYPAIVTTLSWNAASDAIATNGAYRILAWDMERLVTESAASSTTRQTGRVGFVPVSTVSCNPQKPLIAAGYENGRVVVAQEGQPHELVLRDAGEGAVTTMCWSDDGSHLAFGTSEGEAVVATFPHGFFK